MAFRLSFLLSLACTMLTCHSVDQSDIAVFDIQGHRGCRGLLPENTLVAFERAVLLGVTTLELDVSMSKDGLVVVSHEPWISHEICAEAEESTQETVLSFGRLDYEEIRQFDCGSKPHPRFPEQKNLPAFKPLLSHLFDHVDSICEQKNLKSPQYNIEIKSKPAWDGVHYRSIEDFGDSLMRILKTHDKVKETTMQCFDIRVLEYYHTKYPEVELVYLIESESDVDQAMSLLSFVPQVYSPYFDLLDKKAVDRCHDLGMLVIPWTVNDETDISRILSLGVDGMISDYPDRLLRMIQE